MKKNKQTCKISYNCPWSQIHVHSDSQCII